MWTCLSIPQGLKTPNEFPVTFSFGNSTFLIQIFSLLYDNCLDLPFFCLWIMLYFGLGLNNTNSWYTKVFWALHINIQTSLWNSITWQFLYPIEYSQASSWVTHVDSESTNASRTTSVLIMRRTEMILKTLVDSKFKHLMWLLAQEYHTELMHITKRPLHIYSILHIIHTDDSP